MLPISYVDAEKPFEVGSKEDRLNSLIDIPRLHGHPDAVITILIFAMIKLAQKVDETNPDLLWPADVYIDIFTTFANNSHEGTGSDHERGFHFGLAVLCAVLALRAP